MYVYTRPAYRMISKLHADNSSSHEETMFRFRVLFLLNFFTDANTRERSVWMYQDMRHVACSVHAS